MIRKFILLSLVSSVAFAAPALAQKAADAPKDAAKDAPKESVLKKTEKTPLDEWRAAENAMIDKLDDKGKETIFILRNKYSVIRAIGVAERDVGAAVKACGKQNPDIKDKMDARFAQWQDAVKPIVSTAEKSLKSEVEKQKLVKPSEFNNVIKLNDAAFKYGDERTVKKPVSSKKACEELVDSMDDTEDRMIRLLQNTLLPEGVIKSRAEKAAKAK